MSLQSSRLPERTVYNFSGSEDDSDSGLGASLDAGHSPGTVPPLEVKEPGKSDVSRAEEAKPNEDGQEIGEASSVVDVIGHQYGFQRQRPEEANLNKEGEEISSVVDVIGHQYGFQRQRDEDYLVMGGGFCMADDDINEEQSRKPLELVKEKDVSEGSACPDTLFVDSNVLKAEFSNSESAGQASGLEARLHAVPFLRRKKRRAS